MIINGKFESSIIQQADGHLILSLHSNRESLKPSTITSFTTTNFSSQKNRSAVFMDDKYNARIQNERQKAILKIYELQKLGSLYHWPILRFKQLTCEHTVAGVSLFGSQ
ncbi:hypothetical protein NI467_00475 [Acinetobacter bohemicus]|uniref:hypothetical protein n=1 Tax=unclassified Acinetobacter TaxID=196816 RepID=UPI00117353EA|nr:MULTISPECIES: hypothetical protein [unclassified Acinetobacter]MCO8043855.1 hypothetical protein [Acinetobacter sp. S4397-1]TQR61110.1 hypothetical protein E2K52_12070 [Acinetobacter sp. RF14B]